MYQRKTDEIPQQWRGICTTSCLKCESNKIYSQVRTRRTLMQVKDVPLSMLSARRGPLQLYRVYMALAPFWFSTEHLSSALRPFWLSADDMITTIHINSKTNINAIHMFINVQIQFHVMCFNWFFFFLLYFNVYNLVDIGIIACD